MEEANKRYWILLLFGRQQRAHNGSIFMLDLFQLEKDGMARQHRVLGRGKRWIDSQWFCRWAAFRKEERSNFSSPAYCLTIMWYGYAMNVNVQLNELIHQPFWQRQWDDGTLSWQRVSRFILSGDDVDADWELLTKPWWSKSNLLIKSIDVRQIMEKKIVNIRRRKKYLKAYVMKKAA